MVKTHRINKRIEQTINTNTEILARGSRDGGRQISMSSVERWLAQVNGGQRAMVGEGWWPSKSNDYTNG